MCEFEIKEREFQIKVLHYKRDAIPNDHEYVGRPSVLGNPFHIGVDGHRDEVIAKYRAWLWDQLKEDGNVKAEIDRLAEKFIRQRGLALVCWCAPLPCHADVIASAIEWRNQP